MKITANNKTVEIEYRTEEDLRQISDYLFTDKPYRQLYERLLVCEVTEDENTLLDKLREKMLTTTQDFWMMGVGYVKINV